jgi:hypothetical protein
MEQVSFNAIALTSLLCALSILGLGMLCGFDINCVITKKGRQMFLMVEFE